MSDKLLSGMYATLPFAASETEGYADEESALEEDSGVLRADSQDEADELAPSSNNNNNNHNNTTKSNGAKPKRKKKANRACFHCQKAHLTCEDTRPCSRCVKRNLADTCMDGKRKKAKYLHDFDDEVLGRRNSATPLNGTAPIPPSPEVQHEPAFSATDTSSFNNPLFAEPSPPQLLFQDDFAPEFGSKAATSEYAVLSSMLNGSASITRDPSAPSYDYLPPNVSGAPFFATTPAPNSVSFSSTPAFSPMPLLPSGPSNQSPSTPAAPLAKPPFDQRPPNGELPNQPSAETAIYRTPAGAMRADDVYKHINKPYPYAQQYQVLIKHLKERFEKNDILRIVRALAVFRPSLIALQMPLTEEDEIFAEKCFQRTLIEFEKLISFSATPTVVWRRTGEICLVGMEFSLLTKWDRKDLLKSQRYIFELFDQQSTVEYYESFAMHAFENSTQAVMSTCVLLTPDRKPVPCSFCFTIKRDLFNCPSAVLGQFLPLLQ